MAVSRGSQGSGDEAAASREAEWEPTRAHRDADEWLPVPPLQETAESVLVPGATGQDHAET